jgi:hypothetical protein
VNDKKEKTEMEQLFDELKKELVFLPDNDMVREGFLFGFKYTLIY